ncbi:MAG: hypothetical protein HC840_27475 [Leptolyngbyaceae cyanobacterium RM2_2_4]|nr:hypothetical protein [Leptolyngbyaceae cyanobacterium SM1_4_3]NJO52516.1 hypothetical protein [Leptolyngbyaceae cyanobacterium RM2_2_4]
MKSSQDSQSITLFSKPETGKVEKTITSSESGRVKFQGSYWPAQFYYPSSHLSVNPDEVVTIVGRQGITLLIVPEGSPLPHEFSSNAPIQSNKDNLRSAEWSQKLSSRLSVLLKLKRSDDGDRYLFQA